MKKIKLDRYTIIRFCTLFFSIMSYLFLIQLFVKKSFGLPPVEISLNGFEIIFGGTKEYVVQAYPSYIAVVTYKGTITTMIGFIGFSIAFLLQILCIVLTATKKASQKTCAIINLVSALLIIAFGIIMFFSLKLFEKANDIINETEFLPVGLNTSAICILTTGIVTLLNSYDLVKKHPA